ncbi:hypothetical protein Leryth_015458 [Lithospermum erythrorhizon]|nr:hypothetical protein Leryth_015458 [Lithospermum erythrorhizon]
MLLWGSLVLVVLRLSLGDNNVNNTGMRFDPGARTALAFVTLRKDGEREFMFYRNPSADILITEPCKSAHIAAAKIAKDAGCQPHKSKRILSIWDTADVIKDEEEISFLTQGEDPYDDSVVRKL